MTQNLIVLFLICATAGITNIITTSEWTKTFTLMAIITTTVIVMQNIANLKTKNKNKRIGYVLHNNNGQLSTMKVTAESTFETNRGKRHLVSVDGILLPDSIADKYFFGNRLAAREAGGLYLFAKQNKELNKKLKKAKQEIKKLKLNK